MSNRTLGRLARNISSLALDRLEERCLLSAAHHAVVDTIALSLAPAVVQTGLDALASTDGLEAPADTQDVYLGNSRGVETYTIDLSATGTSSVLTVDQKGNPVTAPVKSSITFADVTSSNSVVSDEISAIAGALNLTPPADTTNVNVLTGADKSATYTITLASAAATGRHARSTTFSVDSNGDPTGNQRLPLSVFSKDIQDGLVSNAPAGATALTDTSTVSVQTQNGVTTYSAAYQSTGIRTTVTVDDTGALADLPSTTSTQYALIPPAAQTELQTLATANGYTSTISDTQKVSAYDEANGTTIYSVRLPVTGTGHSGATYTYMIAVASDQDGNPTVPPGDDGNGFGGCDGGGGFGFGGFGGFGEFGGFGSGGGGSGGNGGGSFGGGSFASAFSGFSRVAFARGFRF